MRAPRICMLAGVVALLCACANDSDDGGDAGGDSSIEITTSSSTSTSSSASSSTSSSVDEGDVDAFCDAAAEYTAAIDEIDDADGSARERVEAIEAAVEGVSVPSAIADDFDLYVEGLQRFAQYEEDYATNPSTATSFSASEGQQYSNAARAVREYLDDTCDIST